MDILFPHDPFWWWPALRAFAALHLLALAAWPWTTRVCAGFRDRGAALALPGGIFIYLLILQIAWRTGFLGLHPVWCWFLVALSALAAWGCHARSPRPTFFGTKTRMRRAALRGWLVFALLYGFWAWVRSADPTVAHTEQPMDAMWLRAAMASDAPPVRDAWFGGAPATYYAEGHQNLAFLGTLFGEPAAVMVNLGQILWFALTGLLAFEAAGRLADRRRFQSGAGGLGLLLTLFLSTPRGMWDTLTTNGEGWWWWRASRVIADGSTALITEFPFFSFWLGDNHAHVLGLPFLFLALLAAAQLRRVRRLDAFTLLPAALAVVWSWRVNPWQTPTALAVVGLGLLLRRRRPSLSELKSSVWGAVLPFLLFFPLREPGLSSSVGLNPYGHTGPVEFLKVFGFLLPGVLLLGVRRGDWLPKALALLGIAMLLTAEALVVHDLFQSRMNTVFKVYYQVWILWGVAGGVGWNLAFNSLPRLRPALWALLLVPACGWLYAARLSGGAFAADARSPHAWSRLPSAEQHLLHTADRLIRPGDRIAEAPGESYQAHTSLLGTWTAGSTLVGWGGHQVQWRTGVRFPDLDRIYRAESEADLRQALRDLEVDWVLAGPNERDRYRMSEDWRRWMRERGFVVVDLPTFSLYRIGADYRK